MRLQYRIQYKIGSSNAAADALSWCKSLMLWAVSVCAPMQLLMHYHGVNQLCFGLCQYVRPHGRKKWQLDIRTMKKTEDC
jgi:hypothetical protein